ncbi:protein grindelwald [Aethina tumida]|uniref:protein grindelwald n=1 Tax=Aethina tumida TaxID=116153 RepID=UPI00096B51DA|nr:protein grindelwald [Aethina tumida]
MGPKVFACLCLCTLVLGVQAQLNVGLIQCGQRTCKELEYCSEIDRTCQPCAKICDRSNHNFEASLCTKSCQDYLHDQMYVRKGVGKAEDLRVTVDNLTHLVTVSLTLTCLVLIILACVLGLQLYRWAQKKNITLATIKQRLSTKKSEENSGGKTTAQQPEQPTKKPDLRLEIPPSVAQSDHSPVTMTTSISRRPAEDSTLDYAYDNPAMTNSTNADDGRKLHDVLI